MNSSSRNRATLVGLVVALTAACFLIFRQHRQTQSLTAQLQTAQAQATEAASLQAEVERLRNAEADAKRLREQNRDLPRLWSELTRLRQELANATNRSPAPPVTRAPETPPPAVMETNFVTFTGTARASLVPGQTLVMGGWPLEPGKRTLALFTHEVGGGGQPGAIQITGLYVQVPEDILSGSSGWEQFQAVTKDADSSGVFDAAEAKELVEALKKIEGVVILSQPRLTTSSGVAGTISVGEANGASVNTTLSPVLSPDNQTIELVVSNAIRRLATAQPTTRP